MTTVGPRRSLTEASWEALFDFLDPRRGEKNDRDRDKEAEAKFEEIRRKLVWFFAGRACQEADDLAIETTLRVAAKSAELCEMPHAERTKYFYGVARNVLHEWHRESRREWTSHDALSRELAGLSTVDADTTPDELNDRDLEQCLSRLTTRARQLILKYYSTDKDEKAEGHRVLAHESGKTVNAMRIEVCRIRRALRQCMDERVRSCAGRVPGSMLSR
ncbi:MAG TPA: hypothetical protein VN700_14485 [Vicinamibacterales bacterium]|jgi:DNA-directed RNA polymerase specialized sigma24 family protein|nr:hypothetical protein [Vicinamibacterales bacterium]HXT70965.1 hypothetical protein [Vicinamibacterales bacterium]